MSGHSRPILVVDDDEVLAELLAAILSSVGHEVIIAANGADAVQRARADSPCLVICDMSMPGLSGADVLLALREDPALAGLPFVLMSGAPQTLSGPQPNAFLQKPFVLAEVIDLVTEITTPAAIAA
jgi:CheY-like chemotaxis protein